MCSSPLYLSNAEEALVPINRLVFFTRAEQIDKGVISEQNGPQNGPHVRQQCDHQQEREYHARRLHLRGVPVRDKKTTGKRAIL